MTGRVLGVVMSTVFAGGLASSAAGHLTRGAWWGWVVAGAAVVAVVCLVRALRREVGRDRAAPDVRWERSDTANAAAAFGGSFAAERIAAVITAVLLGSCAWWFAARRRAVVRRSRA
ncbi:hypothetical protein [Spirilliplanes yamanashiensis]|uniref:Uncharacterized protein n=1 Tax=Spirilliplanes yamanashiensis TaxID=42233 RepID=A0A8J4DMI2_9ACTN|nr:hypothetical protein [Spirilliplanes yamanashiensis]MDP9816716.1 hypothetical protein [Spirilliplanes yamanashiensis]GIJ06239.1 hypothetical protein Sya03_55910 [Spirilliplanes yamanashiensis]